MTGSIEPATISLSKAAEIIMACPLEIPVFIWGDTGVGKTAMIEQIGRMLDIPVMITIAQITTPVDWTGVPHLETIDGVKYTRFSKPRHLPNPALDGERGIYFFDELPNATKSVQAAIQSLLTRGEYNGYVWPTGWKQIAAGNRLSHKANTYEMPRPVKNRMMHLYVGYNPEAWLAWAAGSEEATLRMPERSFPSIEDLREAGQARVNPLVRAFIHARSELFHSESESFESFATPRTWHYVSYVMMLNLPEDLQIIMIQGLVGPGPAAEFTAYLKNTCLLPDPADLLSGKAKLIKHRTGSGRASTRLEQQGRPDLELEASQLYAVACSLASAVKKREHLDGFFDCVAQFASDEYGIVAVKELAGRMPEVTALREFTEWTERPVGIS